MLWNGTHDWAIGLVNDRNLHNLRGFISQVVLHRCSSRTATQNGVRFDVLKSDISARCVVDQCRNIASRLGAQRLCQLRGIFPEERIEIGRQDRSIARWR